MYVEDNRDVNSVNMQLFKEFFSHVDLAEDGLKALELYEKNSYDIVISDLNIPKMSGTELIKNILKINENQLVIVITAYDKIEYEILLKDINIKYILKKPVKYKKLLYGICSCIDELTCTH